MLRQDPLQGEPQLQAGPDGGEGVLDRVNPRNSKGNRIPPAPVADERYQVLGRKTLYFDERRLVEGILRSMGGGADS